MVNSRYHGVMSNFALIGVLILHPSWLPDAIVRNIDWLLGYCFIHHAILTLYYTWKET